MTPSGIGKSVTTGLPNKVCPRLRDSACWRSGEITQPRTSLIREPCTPSKLGRLPKVLPNPTEVSENEAIEAVQFGNMARSTPTMEEADAASAAP